MIQVSKDYMKQHLDNDTFYVCHGDEYTTTADLNVNAPVYVGQLFTSDMVDELDSVALNGSRIQQLKNYLVHDTEAFKSLHPKNEYFCFSGISGYHITSYDYLHVTDGAPIDALNVKGILDRPNTSQRYVSRYYNDVVENILTGNHADKSAVDVIKEICKCNNVDPSISEELVGKIGWHPPKTRLELFEEYIGLSEDEALQADQKYQQGRKYDQCVILADDCGLTLTELHDVLSSGIEVRKEITMSHVYGLC